MFKSSSYFNPLLQRINTSLAIIFTQNRSASLHRTSQRLQPL